MRRFIDLIFDKYNSKLKGKYISNRSFLSICIYRNAFVSAYTQLTRQPDNESQHLRCIIRADNSHVHTIETCLAMMSIE